MKKTDQINISSYHWLLILLIVTVFQGCIFTSPYNVQIRNVGTSKISHASVTFNKKTISAGWVSPDQTKTHIDLTAPIPEKATVSWRRENGTMYSEEVFVKNKLPSLTNNQHIYLIFQVGEDNTVELTAIKCTSNMPCPEAFGKRSLTLIRPPVVKNKKVH